jgi:hypothetical protein
MLVKCENCNCILELNTGMPNNNNWLCPFCSKDMRDCNNKLSVVDSSGSTTSHDNRCPICKTKNKEKTATRTKLCFIKTGDYYKIKLIIDGCEFNTHGFKGIVTDFIYLGEIPTQDITKFLNIYKNSDVDVIQIIGDVDEKN